MGCGLWLLRWALVVCFRFGEAVGCWLDLLLAFIVVMLDECVGL